MSYRDRLNAYLKAVRGEPFAWGQHDCLIFTNGAFRAMYGEGWAEDWLGRYIDGNKLLKVNELKQEFGYDMFYDAVDDRLQRVKHVPPLGSLVTTNKARRWAIGAAMGICTGTKGAFLNRTGVVYLPLDDIDASWVRA